MIARILVSLFLTTLALPVSVLSVAAQDQNGAASIQFNFLKVDGLVVGKKLALDDAYEQAAGRPIPTRLEMIIPTARDKFFVGLETRPAGGLVKINFGTLDKAFVDSVHIIDASVALGPLQDRLASFAALLRNQALPAAVADMQDAKLVALRNYQMGRYPAVELVATYTDPAIGPMYLRIVGVPHPTKAESIVIVININATLVPLQDISQLPDTLSGRTIRTIRFTD